MSNFSNEAVIVVLIILVISTSAIVLRLQSLTSNFKINISANEDDASSTGSSPIPGKAPANQETTVQDVHNIIILNSVALYCMKRDLNRAKRILAQHLSTLNDGEVPAQATMLLVYIELRQGLLS